MKLKELISAIEVINISGSIDIEIDNIVFNSKEVTPESVFVCIVGFKDDGHKFASEAVKKGAVVVVTEREVKLEKNAVVIKVKDTKVALEKLAAKFYANPVNELYMIGVTGTDGKTTTTYLIESILKSAGKKTGVIGTINYRVDNSVVPSNYTTPTAMQLQKILREMADKGVKYLVMEVSSHALEMNRINPAYFNIGIFTNLTSEHLDFHNNMENYFQAKLKLFKNLKQFAIVNNDDKMAERIIPNVKGVVITYGIDRESRFKAENIVCKTDKTDFFAVTPEGKISISLKMRGRHNVYNALAALSCAYALKIDKETAKKGLESVLSVPGRFESIDEGQKFSVIVDYAHTPFALEKSIKAAKELLPRRIITVFGCGGDRDKTKRPAMGKIASEFSDFFIITSDNPRSEEPMAIIKDIEKGINGNKKNNYLVFVDRKKAIEEAFKMAKEKDIVLIAGKGHESVQIMKNEVIPFDDREISRELLKKI